MAGEELFFINPKSGEAFKRGKGGKFVRYPAGDRKRNPRRKRRNPAGGSLRDAGGMALRVGGGALGSLAVKWGVRKVFGTDGALSPWLPGIVNVGGGLVVGSMASPLIGAGMFAGGVVDLGMAALNRFMPGALSDDVEQLNDEIDQLCGVADAVPQLGPGDAKAMIDRFAAGSAEGLVMEGGGGLFGF